jgi:spermidine synthase
MQNLNAIGTANSGQVGVPIAQPVNPGWMAKFLWIGLPAIASTLLLATTNQITQEVAVIPFLWVIPLSLYLLSFILCFESDRWYGRIRFFIMMVLALGVYGLTMSQGPLVEFWVQIAAYCFLLFVVCMVCHGELARLRPEADRLSQFYLLLSFGGALGSMFVNLVAPVIFIYYWELPAALISCLLVCLVLFWLGKQKPVWFLRLIFSLVYIGIGAWIVQLEIKYGQDILYGSEWISRNFFGVMRVKEISVQPKGEPAYQFVHGITIHGLQFKDPLKRGEKTTYYTEDSGAGLAFRFYPDRLEPMTAGILGLGIGTQAAYGREGDEFRFYEINPDVIEIANGYGGFYTYLKDSDADIRIVLGDARISLEEELRVTGSNLFDLLILDTFSSDAIPVHLITQEAFDIYLKHLKPEGILAIHISNNHLDLKPVVWGLAKYYQLGTAQVVAAKSAPGSSTSVWMLLTHNQSFLNLPAIRPFQISSEDKIKEIPMWTDDFSNLISILK